MEILHIYSLIEICILYCIINFFSYTLRFNFFAINFILFGSFSVNKYNLLLYSLLLRSLLATSN